MTDFGEGKWTFGRKPHRCAACQGPIPQGEKHYHYRGMYEGDWQNWRLHKECHDDWERDGCGEISMDAPCPKRLSLELEAVNGR